MYASLSLCGLCVWRSSKEASCVQRPSGLKQEVSAKQSSSRHRASGVLRVCCGCTRGDKTRTGRTQCTRGVSGVCSGCAQGGGRPSACSVRGTGLGRRGCGGRLSDVCSQQKPQASGNTNRVCSGGAAAVSSHHPAAACTHWRGYAALDAHCVLCGRAAVCGCVRLCQARSEGQAEGREAEGGGRRGEAEGREAGGGRQKGGQGGRITQKGEAPKTTACVSSR